jgi:predicted dithiol-disulfide oxidoreductase (DUF899 family)
MEKEIGMGLPRIATQAEWLAAREELLAEEQELGRARDALVVKRRGLPMVEIIKDYAFGGPKGQIGLLDLFEGRRQLLVYHFWFEPGAEPCEGCSMWMRNLGSVADLNALGTSLALVSPAPSAEIESVKERRGWTVPWFSTVGGDFSADSGYTGEAQITVFVRAGNTIFRTYVTASGRDLETLSNHWTLLDLTPLGTESA